MPDTHHSVIVCLPLVLLGIKVSFINVVLGQSDLPPQQAFQMMDQAAEWTKTNTFKKK